MTTPGQARDGWNGVAAGYDEFVTPLVIPLAEQVLAGSMCVAARDCSTWRPGPVP